MQIHNTTSLLRFNFTNESQKQALFNRLVEGQTLEARVMDEVSEGRWAVRFMGHTLVAESRLALAPGQRVNARVESMGPPLVLSLTGHTRAEDAAMDRAFQSLGLPDTAANRAIVRGLIEALQVLDTMQAANVPTADRVGLALQFPFVVDGQTTTADLEMFYHKGGDGGVDSDNLRFTLAVDLSGLGQVKFELTVVKKQVICRVYAEDDAKVAFLEEEADGLKKALETCGYAVAEIQCRTPLQDNRPPPDQPPSVGVDFRV